MVNYLLPCAYKSLFGIDCPICGFQRALVWLLKGDFTQSFSIYPPLLPVVFLMMIFSLHLFKRKLISRNFLNYYSLLVLTFISVNYIIKLTMWPT